MGKRKYLSAFEWGMVVGARVVSLSVSRTATLLGFSQSTVSHVYQEWSTTQRTCSQLDTTVGSIGVNMGQHPCGKLSTLCRVNALTN
jgi:predicted alpha/beta hydrolase